MPNSKPHRLPVKRTHSRVTAFIPVTIHTQSGNVVQGEIEDISEGGALVRCPRALADGERVRVEIRFSGLKTVFGSVIEPEMIEDGGILRAEEIAEVRWGKSEVCFGFQFVNLSPATRRFLKKLVKYFAKMKVELDALEKKQG